MAEVLTREVDLLVSEMAETLIGSEIIKLASDIKERIRAGEKILNYTIGDFDPSVFPVPADLKSEIRKAYHNNETNYPAAEGILELRRAVSQFLKRQQHLDYSEKDILIACGARPLIYGTYATVLDPGDLVIFPVPSWNNNHYCHLLGAEQCAVETFPENNFMPVKKSIAPHIKKAAMIALCSPLNPSGTVFPKETLSDICQLILNENTRRKGKAKPLYLLYDQIYQLLTAGNTVHYDPVNIFPEMKDYTIYIDGISKCFASTGVRVGWAFGPNRIMEKMKAILSHVGAWAPKAEQVATANFLSRQERIDDFMSGFRGQINMRLTKFYEGFVQLKSEGFPVNAIAPQAAIYLTVQFDLHGYRSKGGTLSTTADISRYLLDEAKIAMVPFYAFGAAQNSTWYRLSVGTTHLKDIEPCFLNLRKALSKLSR